jgi:hypothetical protein
LLGEGADHGAAKDPVAHRDVAHILGHLDDVAGELAARYEWRRHRQLVLVGDQQDVGKIDRRRFDADAGLRRSDSGVGDIL